MSNSSKNMPSQRLVRKVLENLSYQLLTFPAVRDISFLTASIFTQSHLVSMKKFFGVNFKFIFWFVQKENQLIFYRSAKGYSALSRKLGTQYLSNRQYAKKISDKLISMSDEITFFLSKNKSFSQFIKGWNNFYKLYRDWFAYHQAVYFGTEYILQNYGSNKRNQTIIQILDRAYKYNENIAPQVEDYFLKLKISHLHHQEISQDHRNLKHKKNELRSILIIDGREEILTYQVARLIHRAIQRDYRRYIKKIAKDKSISGIVANHGHAKGRVRLVTDLSQLKLCQLGEVLVASQTRPQYNSFIKKVKAIITDEGGMLCHAAIISRELGIPCIIGTKIATRVLKDGDIVEVDANKGTVKILDKNRESRL